MIEAVLAWIDRQGGMLVAPKRTLAELHQDEGVRDGTWVLVAYLLAAHVDDVVTAFARVVSLRDAGALLSGAADVAIGLVAPFITMFVVEIVLGRERAHRAALCLAPMLAIAAVLHLLDSFGVLVLPERWLPGVIAGVPCLPFAAWVRDAVPLRKLRGDA